MPPLSPVSETSDDSDSYYDRRPRSAGAPPPKTYNFSRPHPAPARQARVRRDPPDTPGRTHAISAFHDPVRDFPDEPRFSCDSEHTDSLRSENSAGSEFAWDGQAGELKSRRRPKAFDDQRSYAPDPRGGSALGGRGGGGGGGGGRPPSSRRSTDPSTNSAPPPPSTIGIPSSSRGSSSAQTATKRPGILKTVSFDQQSARTSVMEDGASHHTASSDGASSMGSVDMDGNWQSSDYDISGLSESQIRKLRKKGINPALYAEMQAARKGKSKWVGPLVGNTFLG